MNIRAMCSGRAYHLVRSGSFHDIAQIKHQLEAEGYDTNHLNDRGLCRGLALRRMYLSRKRMALASRGLMSPSGCDAPIRHADDVIAAFRIVRWP
jgi:hypothetical protein